MNIRSVTALEAAVDRDMASRKRTLTALKFAFDGARGHEREVLGAAAVTLLYAHWEGFVKFAGKCFTNYVFSLGLPYGKLSNGIVATCLRAHIRGLRETKKVSLNRDIVGLLRDRESEVPRIPWNSAIATYDNLSSEVLDEILLIVGCDSGPYLTKYTFVDEKLLRHRNAIAHNGYDPDFDLDDVPVLFAEVVTLMTQFSGDVQNAASLKRYKR